MRPQSSTPLILSATALGLALTPACDPIGSDESIDESVDARSGLCDSPPLPGAPSASGSWAGGQPPLAFDGDPETVWLSDQSDGAWLALDLGVAQTIDHVRVQWRWDYNFGQTATSVVETSADGVSWTPVGMSVRERESCLQGQASCTAPEDLHFAPVQARHVRLRALAWNGGWGHVNELQVFAPCSGKCTPGDCGDVFVLNEYERRSVDAGALDQPLALPRTKAGRFCKQTTPLLSPGTLLLAGPHPELVDLVNQADPSMWRNPFGFARELVSVDCDDPATVFVHTARAALDREQYGLSSGHIKGEGPGIMQRPPVGPEPAGLNGTFIQLVQDGQIVVETADLAAFPSPPTYDKPPMPPILPPVPAQTGLNACTTPQPLELGEGSPEDIAAASPWKVKHKLVKGPKEIEAEVDVDIDGEVQLKIEPCIDLNLDPVNGSTGHLGFNVRWAGEIGVKFAGKGVYKRKVSISPNPDENTWAKAGALAKKFADRAYGIWLIWVPTPAGVPIPVVVEVYPVLELELAVGGEASFEAKTGAKGVQFGGVRVEKGPKVTPYYGGNMEKELDADNLKGEASALWEVRANVKIETRATVLGAFEAKLGIVPYGSVEQKVGGDCNECKLEVGAEAVAAVGGGLPFKLVPELDWEVEWVLWNPRRTWTHPGLCTGHFSGEVPPLDPVSGVYEPIQHAPVGAPKRCPFKAFMMHGPGAADADTNCKYPEPIGLNYRRADLWALPGGSQIVDGWSTKDKLKAILVESWMNDVPKEHGWNTVSIAPGWGWPDTTKWTPWVYLNMTRPDLKNQEFDAGLQIGHTNRHQPSAKWFKVPKGVDYFGDYVHFFAAAFNMRVIGAEWDDGEVQIAEDRRFCPYEGVMQTPPAIPPSPFFQQPPPPPDDKIDLP
jgi:hypothetical protein